MRPVCAWCVAAAAAFGVFGAASGGNAAPLVYNLVAGQDTASGPPYPASTIDFNINFTAPPEPEAPILKFKLDDAGLANPPEPDFPVSLRGSIGSPLRTGGGLAAIVDFGLAYPPDPGRPLLIIPCVDILLPDGTMLRLGVPPDPILGADRSFFDVFFNAQFGDGSVFNQRIHFAINDGQDFSFDGPTAELGHSIDMSFLLTYGGNGFDANGPVFTATITGERVSEPATLALLGLGLGMLGTSRHRRAAAAPKERSDD